MGNIVICCVDEKRNFDPFPEKEELNTEMNPHALTTFPNKKDLAQVFNIIG